jgi:hypothetical protein
MPMYGPMSGYGTPGINPAANGPMAMPGDPFIWGRGGQRMSPDDIVQQRRLAMARMAQGTDTSPVGHWTQGAGRVASGLLGGLEMRQIDRKAEESRTAQQEIIEALVAGGEGSDPNAIIAAALADPELRQIGMSVMEARQPKPVEPVIQRQNDGSIIGLHPLTGEVLFTRADPNPKPVVDWITANNSDGTKSLIPVGANGPMTGGQGGPPATLPPDFDFGEGGPTQPASANFSASFRGLPGEQVTSTFRSPERNRAVGGVENSFHMRRDAQGNPMARDSVPPAGMSMGAYAAELRRLNPHLQVINEGDHVHMEPR